MAETLSLPKTKDFKGILVSTSVLDGGVVLLTVETREGSTETIATSESYWNKVGRSFQIDKPVTVTAEVRIANKTGYAADPSKPEKLTAHTRDGMNLTRITAMASTTWSRMEREEEKAGDIQLILGADPEYAGPIAAYLAGKK